MQKERNYRAETAMLIRKPVTDVFEAFIDPKITSKFWFTKGSGKLEEGKSIDWTWEMYNHTITVVVRTVISDKKIIVEWGDDHKTTIAWTFKSLGDSKTFVTITNSGFKGTTGEIISQIIDATGGFTWVLAGLKAFLEHDVELNLIADRHPKELEE